MDNGMALKNGTQSHFWSEVKKHFISALIGAVAVGVPFYFNTNAALNKNSGEIIELQSAYKRISDDISGINLKLSVASVEPANTKNQIDAMRNEIKQISDRQDKMSERQDKIYDLLIQMSKR